MGVNYAEIVIEKKYWPRDRTLYYAIPLSLSQEIKLGKRVLVPLLAQRVIGYVVGFSAEPGVTKVKSILGVLDPEPLFDETLLELARWMKGYYLCTLGDALNCLIPTGTTPKLIKKIRLVLEAEEKVREAISQLDVKKPNIVGALEVMLNQKEISYGELQEKLGKREASKLIKIWQEKGYVEIINSFLPPLTKIKHKRVWGLPAEEEALDQKSITSPKQRRILEIIAQYNYQLSSTEIAKMAETSLAPLKSLQQKGFIREEILELERNPLAGRINADLPLALNPHQEECLNIIKEEFDQGSGKTILLHGVTGSGKTEVYLQAIDYILKKGRQAIILVPEISLTPQTLDRFRKRFGSQIAVLHSHLSLGERYDQWRKIRRGEVNIVIGARSALFAPLSNLGIIIIDEEHETSYKQEDNPRYHARELARKRVELAEGILILGTATPTLETYYRTQMGEYAYIHLPSRVDDRPLPQVEIVDMRLELQQGNRSVFSQSLVKGIEERLAKGEQTILFLNRRGFSTFVLCRECGLVMKCPHCEVSLTYHSEGHALKCHYCDYQENVPDVCPRCQSRYIRYFGTGTQKVEEELGKKFPQARVLRMDMDTTRRKDAHQEMLSKFANGQIDILLGTQMIAKGLDFPGVTLVGVITADTLLNFPDFRGAERTFQLLTQVAGRAGRGELAGQVIVQTYNPEHYSIISAGKQDFLSFYQQEIEYRRQLDYPPFSYLANITVKGEDERTVISKIEEIAYKIKLTAEGTEVLGPVPAPLSKIKQMYRWQLILKNRNLEELRNDIRTWKDSRNSGYLSGPVGIIIDIEPLGML